MTSSYTWLKLLHVLSVVAWIGGSLALTILGSRIAQMRDSNSLSAFSKAADFYGRAVIGSASGTALLSGLAMAFMSHMFGLLWIQLGLGGIVIHGVFGPGLLNVASARLAKLATATPRDDSAIQGAAQRLKNLSRIYLLFMAIVIAVMVLKPT